MRSTNTRGVRPARRKHRATLLASAAILTATALCIPVDALACGPSGWSNTDRNLPDSISVTWLDYQSVDVANNSAEELELRVAGCRSCLDAESLAPGTSTTLRLGNLDRPRKRRLTWTLGGESGTTTFECFCGGCPTGACASSGTGRGGGSWFLFVAVLAVGGFRTFSLRTRGFVDR